MIEFILHTTLTLSALTTVLLLAHRLSLKHLGARTTYSLWGVIPLAVLLTAISPLITSGFEALFVQFGINEPYISKLFAFSSNSGATKLLPTNTVITAMFSALWLVGACTMLGAMLLDRIRLSRFSTVRMGHLQVQRSHLLSSPAIFGVLKPTLQLPSDFMVVYSKEERHLILKHELAHWQRGDTKANILAWLLLSTQWFNPIAWWGYHRFRADQELACDADVLAGQPNGMRSYTNALLKSISSPSPQRESNFWDLSCCSTHYGVNKRSYTMMKERFETITRPQKSSMRPLVIGSSVALLMAVAINLPAHSQDVSEQQVKQNAAATPILRIEPRYPESAVEKGIEGHVDLSFKISDDGKTTNIKVLDSQPEGVFDEAVVAAFERWRYAPIDDKTRSVRIQMKIGE